MLTNFSYSRTNIKQYKLYCFIIYSKTYLNDHLSKVKEYYSI